LFQIYLLIQVNVNEELPVDLLMKVRTKLKKVGDQEMVSSHTTTIVVLVVEVVGLVMHSNAVSVIAAILADILTMITPVVALDVQTTLLQEFVMHSNVVNVIVEILVDILILLMLQIMVVETSLPSIGSHVEAVQYVMLFNVVSAIGANHAVSLTLLEDRVAVEIFQVVDLAGSALPFNVANAREENHVDSLMNNLTSAGFISLLPLI